MKKTTTLLLAGAVAALTVACGDGAGKKSAPMKIDNSLTEAEKSAGILTPEVMWKMGRVGGSVVSPDGETAHGYREDGYFPEAFINMLALLGWNPGTEQEIFSMQELIDSFSLDRVSKSGARFQPDKARWFNAQYMHHKTDAELAALYQPVLRSHGIEVSDAVAGKAAGIMKERATFTTDLWDLTSFFFEAPREYEEKQVRKYWKGQNPAILRELRDVLAGIDDFSLENTERIVHAWIEEKGYGMGQVMNTLRLALVGAGKGPGMYDVTSFIGKEECLKRIDNLLTNLKPAIE